MEATNSHGLPITDGRLLDFSDDPIACMRELHADHGDLAALREGNQQLVFVFSPKYNKEVLSDSSRFHSRFFAVRGGRKSAQRRITSGLLSMNGEEHKRDRRIVMAPFQRRMLSAYHETITRLTSIRLNAWSPGEVIDMDEEMVQFMLGVTTAILFGLEDQEFANEIGEQIDRWVELNHSTGMGALVSEPQFTDSYSRLLAKAEKLELDVARMVQMRRESDRPPTDVLALLIQAHERGESIDLAKLHGHITLLFGAAHLTTAHTFSWTFFLLAQHPEVHRKLLTELNANVESDTPTFDEIQNLPYLEMVIKESMRVLPASAYSQRMNPKPEELGPLHLPAATPVIFSQFITHHRTDLFAEPEKFIPERWESISPSAYEFLPFGAGPRMCLGAPLAMVELKASLAMMLKKYAFEIVANSEINGKVISTMLGPTDPVPMLVQPSTTTIAPQPVAGNVHSMVDLSHIPASRRKAA